MYPTCARIVRAALWTAAVLSAPCLSGCAASSGNNSTTAARASEAPVDLLAAVKQRGTLIIATDANFKPQSWQTAAGDWEGFDVDVAREVAKRMGVKPVFESTHFDVVAQGNWHQRWDVNVGSMTITTERSRRLWFTEPYYYDPASFAVQASSSIHSIANLSGKKIGASAGSTYLAYLRGKIPTARIAAPSGVRLEQFDNDVPALQALARGDGGKLDAVLSSLSAIRSGISSGMPLRAIEPPVFEESLAIDLDRQSELDSRPLLWEIDGLVQQMRRDGTLRRLSNQYYGVDLSVRR